MGVRNHESRRRGEGTRGLGFTEAVMWSRRRPSFVETGMPGAIAATYIVARNGQYDGIGVFGEGSDNNVIQGNTVEDTVGFFNRDNPSFQGHGIAISHFLNANDPRGLSIFNNNVVDNAVRRNFTAGVTMTSNVNARITGNTIEENGDPERNQSNGIGVSAGDTAQKETRLFIEGNKVNRNGQVGIFVRRGASENQIVRNEFNANSLAGVVRGQTLRIT